VATNKDVVADSRRRCRICESGVGIDCTNELDSCVVDDDIDDDDIDDGR